MSEIHASTHRHPEDGGGDSGPPHGMQSEPQHEPQHEMHHAPHAVPQDAAPRPLPADGPDLEPKA